MIHLALGKSAKVLAASVTLAVLIASTSCMADSIPASRCYLVEGQHDRYKDVDRLARELANRSLLEVKGEHAMTVEFNSLVSRDKVLMHSPFGPHASVITLYQIDGRGVELSKLVDDLTGALDAAGLHSMQCSEVPDLRTPTLHGRFS